MLMFNNLIDGEWLSDGARAPNVNPSDTKDIVGEAVRGTRAQAEAAIAAAKAAFPAWSRSTPQARYDILKKASDEILARKDELGRLLSREEGKTLPEGVGEVARAGQIFAFFAGECLRMAGEKLASVRPGIDIEITREALGVVGLITPWNFPIAIPAWKIAPALAYGNTVVIKPADLVPGSTWALVDILHRAGLPKGVLNLVIGRGSEVGAVLLEHPDVAAISFTGSVATGQKVAAACIASRPMKKFQLEMGGKNPLVVLDDADLKVAVECAANSAFFSTGQRCTAASRLIVTAGIHDKFVEALTERMRGLKVDDAVKAGTDIGPVVDQSQLDQDLKYISIGKDEGAKLAFGGERLNREAPGFYLQPALVHRREQQDADRARGNLWAGGRGHPGQGLCRSAGDRERHRVWPVIRHLHHQPEIRQRLQAQFRSGHGDGEPADRRRRLPCAVRRPKGLQLRRPRTGPLRRRVLYDGQDGLHVAVTVASALRDRKLSRRDFGSDVIAHR